jgi:hypothetical protein
VSDVMRERGAVISSAAQMLSSGDVNLDTMPQLILRIIGEDMWRQRAIPQLGWKLSPEFTSFDEFVTASPLAGLGTSVQMLHDVCRRDTRALEAIDRVTAIEPGTHRPNDNIMRSDQGTSQTYALRRLRKDRPDLLERVLDGEMSAHRAMVAAGFRPQTITVRTDDPQHVARALCKHLAPGQIRELRELLGETIPEGDGNG